MLYQITYKSGNTQIMDLSADEGVEIADCLKQGHLAWSGAGTYLDLQLVVGFGPYVNPEEQDAD